MANNKTGFDYYNLNTDRYLDIRIKRLKKDFGCAGISVYDYILCEVYRVKGCFSEWDESRAFDVAEYFNLKESLVCEIVKYCGSVGLFNKELLDNFSIITSHDIQNQWVKNSMSIDFDSLNREYLLIEESTIPFYKKNKKARLYKRNVKLWHRIIKEVFKRDNYTCQYCGEVGGKLEADHIIPFSKGGSDDIINLLTSCRKCNRQKKDKPYEEFIKSKRTNNNEKK